MIQSICVYSQDTLKITSEQLRTTNLIFSEHKKWSEMIPLLNTKIDNLEFINRSLIEQDSINKIQLNTSINIIEIQEQNIGELNDKLKEKQKIINWGSIGTVVIIILCLL
jgi:hypothetical protein